MKNRATLTGPSGFPLVVGRTLAAAISFTVCTNVAARTAGGVVVDPGPPSSCPEPVQDTKDFARALLDQGQCLLRQANPADALKQYRRVAFLSDASAEQQDFARRWVSHLQLRVAKLIVTAHDGAAPPESAASPLSVTLHSVVTPDVARPINRSNFGEAQEFNPGSYELVISQGTASWNKHICLGAGQTETVNVLLKDDVLCSPPRTCADPAIPADAASCPSTLRPVVASPELPVPPTKRAVDLQHGLGIGFGIAGLVSVGVGTVLALEAHSRDKDSNNYCNVQNNLNWCQPKGIDLNSQAKTLSTASEVSFVAGGLAIIGGAAAYFTAPTQDSSEKAHRVSVGPVASANFQGLLLSGAW